MKKLLSAFKSAPAISAADVETVRERIVALTEERARIEALPRPPEETLERLEAFLDECVDRADLSYFTGKFRWGTASSLPVLNAEGGAILALALISYCCRDVVMSRLGEIVADQFEGKQFATAEEQARLLAEADAEILQLSKAEERAIRAAEAAGVSIARREDAMPAVVLSFDEDLAA